MSDNTFLAVTSVALFILIGFLCVNGKQCEAQAPAAIQACHTACGARGVESAGRAYCECK